MGLIQLVFCYTAPKNEKNPVKISPLNVRSMGDKLKRRETFNWLREKNLHIYLLQEVHCSSNTTSLWSSEWGYKSIFSCPSSARGGVAILFNNNFSFEILRIYSDTNGRFIICDTKIEENVSPWQTYMLQTMTNLDSFKISLST